MREFLEMTSALSDGNRVRALCALRRGELCGCQLIELLKLAPSTVSRHMSILQRAGLVESRKEGRWVHYRLAGKSGSPAATGLVRTTFKALAASPAVLADDKTLKRIRSYDLEKLCKKQATRS